MQNIGGEDSLGEQSNDQGTPESLREERKNFIYDVATAGPVREMCEEKKPEELVRDTEVVEMMCFPTEKPTVAKIEDGNYFASLHSEEDFVSMDEVSTPELEDRAKLFMKEATEETEGEGLPEASAARYPEVTIRSALYEEHGRKGLKAVRSRGIPHKAVDYVAISEWAKVVKEDTLILAAGHIGEHEVFTQVDVGSEISCIQRDHLKALGLEEHTVARSVEQRRRVRGIGTQPGEGEVIARDVWLQIRVCGAEVVGWQPDEVAPIEGGPRTMVIEGWFAVLEKMGVPLLLGGDILEKFDVITRAKHQCVVLEDIKEKKKPTLLKLYEPEIEEK